MRAQVGEKNTIYRICLDIIKGTKPYVRSYGFKPKISRRSGRILLTAATVKKKIKEVALKRARTE